MRACGWDSVPVTTPARAGAVESGAGAADIAASVAAAGAGIVAAVARGRLITIEGIDGAGKTTLAASLLDHLRGRGVEVELLREPGGVVVAEQIRTLVKDPALTIGARAETLLYAAARAQLVEEALQPVLERGAWVLLDRFVDSSLAYQGAGRGLGVDLVRAINDFGTGGLTPDRTLLLELDPALGRTRQGKRLEGFDRLEREEAAFFATIAAAYAALAEAEPERVRRIDASQPAAAVAEQARTAVEDLLDA
jgi:dTMP kinase